MNNDDQHDRASGSNAAHGQQPKGSDRFVGKETPSLNPPAPESPEDRQIIELVEKMIANRRRRMKR